MTEDIPDSALQEVSESSNPHVVAPTMGTAEDSSGFSQRPQKQDSEVKY